MELERAVELEPNKESYTLLKSSYEAAGMAVEADQADQKLQKLIVPSGHAKRVVRPKRVVI